MTVVKMRKKWNLETKEANESNQNLKTKMLHRTSTKLSVKQDQVNDFENLLIFTI